MTGKPTHIPHQKKEWYAAVLGAKDTSQTKAMSNSEEIKSVALTIVKLCLAEGTR